MQVTMEQPMPEITREKVEQVLEQAVGKGVQISGIVVKGEKVGFTLELPQDASNAEVLRQQCESAVKTLPGVGQVTAVLTAHNQGPSTHLPPEQRRPADWNREPLPGVKQVIAIASGKGGVGKSTTTVNLAIAMMQAGKNVAILDADMYGPSIPRMMNAFGKAPVKDGKLVPIESHGVRCLSMGNLLDDEGPVAWRGAMATKAVKQMTRLVHWAPEGEELDVLLIDMPPGTGDVHITMAQTIPMDGAIIVTTPQEVALMDARKSLEMFGKVNVPIWGVIENMAGPIYGEGGGKDMAKDYDVSFLGSLPLDASLREAADTGKPLALRGDSPLTKAYAQVLTKLPW